MLMMPKKKKVLKTIGYQERDMDIVGNKKWDINKYLEVQKEKDTKKEKCIN